MKENEKIDVKTEDVKSNEWKEIEPQVWRPENEGDQIEGVLLKKEPRSGDISARYYIDNDKGKWLVWGSTMLDDKIQLLEDFSLIRITYKGKKELDKNRTLKIFKVESKQPSDER